MREANLQPRPERVRGFRLQGALIACLLWAFIDGTPANQLFAPVDISKPVPFNWCVYLGISLWLSVFLWVLARAEARRRQRLLNPDLLNPANWPPQYRKWVNTQRRRASVSMVPVISRLQGAIVVSLAAALISVPFRIPWFAFAAMSVAVVTVLLYTSCIARHNL